MISTTSPDGVEGQVEFSDPIENGKVVEITEYQRGG